MEFGVASGLLGEAFAPRAVSLPDRVLLMAGLGAVTRLRAGLDALEVAYASELAGLSSFPGA
jgi:hypothetical protein